MSNPSQAEAQGSTTATVKWRDLTPFEVPRYQADWPFAAVVAAENGTWSIFLAEMLPPATLHEFRQMRPTQREAFELIDVLVKALGFGDVGESPASAS